MSGVQEEVKLASRDEHSIHLGVVLSTTRLTLSFEELTHFSALVGIAHPTTDFSFMTELFLDKPLGKAVLSSFCDALP